MDYKDTPVISTSSHSEGLFIALWQSCAAKFSLSAENRLLQCFRESSVLDSDKSKLGYLMQNKWCIHYGLGYIRRWRQPACLCRELGLRGGQRWILLLLWTRVCLHLFLCSQLLSRCITDAEQHHTPLLIPFITFPEGLISEDTLLSSAPALVSSKPPTQKHSAAALRQVTNRGYTPWSTWGGGLLVLWGGGGEAE